jgi:hypothetical protein
MGSAPATLHLTIRIFPSPENRILRAELEGPDFYRASEWDLTARPDQRTFDWWPRDIPCGDYDVRAKLVYWHGMEWQTIQDSRPAKIIGIDCETPPSP